MLTLFTEFALIIAWIVLEVFFPQILSRQWRLVLTAGTVWLAIDLILHKKKVAGDYRFMRTQPKQWFFRLWKEWGEPLIFAFVLAFFIRTFLLGPYKIPTGSMIPTFMVGDRIFVDKVTYRFRPPERGEIIVFKYPQDRKKDFVKRLVGLPGDRIEIRDGKVILNGQALDTPPFSEHYYYNQEGWQYGQVVQLTEIPAESYFVLGDNSAHSSDSRNWGFVPKRNLVGRAFVIWWPPNRIKLVK